MDTHRNLSLTLPQANIPPGGAMIFHGSNTPGITTFSHGENTTVGQGVYFTSDPKAARGYASRRATYRGGRPVLYAAHIGPDLKLADIRAETAVNGLLDQVLPLIKDSFSGNKEWHHILLLDEIDEHHGAGRNSYALNKLGTHFADIFTKHLKAAGFDGVVANEGGEARIGKHDSWVLFDPANATIIREASFRANVVSSPDNNYGID